MRGTGYIYNIGTRVAALLTLVVIAGCATDDADRLPVTDGTVGVDLALNVLSTPGTRGTTRMLPSAVKAESTFNGVEGLYVVPFVVPEERDTVQKDDTPKSGSVTGFTANATVISHYMTEDSDLPVGTNAFLCYAKAKPIGTDYDAAIDGSLTENLSTVFPTIPTVVTDSPADVTFSLKPIQETHATAAAVKILEYMNSIAEAGNWKGFNTGSSQNDQFKLFTNKGEGFGGSLNNILVYVNDWYTKASSIAAIGTNIQAAIHNTEKVTIENGKVTAIIGVSSYPDGLPDGGAVITWNDTYQKFEYTEVKWDADNSKYEYKKEYDLFKNYTYPAQRYFYANSRIYTSNSSQKTAYSASDWTTVLSAYENQGTDNRGVAVNTSTRSVVVKNPLRYGVAGLEIMIKANTATDETGPYLLDDDSKHEQYNDSKVRLTDGKFPLTAVIIGSQVKQNYCFEPANSEDNQEYVIYDTQVQAVKTNETDPSTVYLGECRNAFSAPFYTIGLQTKDELSMKVVLEFENNSGKEFISENGVICNGTKFYMMATVVPPGDMGVEQRVLTRGYMTTIKLTIGSLKSAYNALPNLRSDKLRLFDTVEAGIRKWEDGQPGDHEVHNW